jgi:hypothetical protein
MYMSVSVAVRMFLGGRRRVIVRAVAIVRVVMIVVVVVVVRSFMVMVMTVRSGRRAFVMFMLMMLHRTCNP